MEREEKQAIVREALIKKFEGASNSELMKDYKEHFRNVADMYSQFRSYLFALAKTHPDTILELLKSTTKVVMKSVSRSLKIDNERRLRLTSDILSGIRYDKVAEKHDLSIARARGIFMEVVKELSKKHSLGIPDYFGKKQIVAVHKDRLISVISNELKGVPSKKGVMKISPSRKSPKGKK